MSTRRTVLEALSPPGRRTSVVNDFDGVPAYLGDDRGDLPAFAATLDLGGTAVVVLGARTALQVRAVPGLALEGAHEVVPFLQELATALAARPVPEPT